MNASDNVEEKQVNNESVSSAPDISLESIPIDKVTTGQKLIRGYLGRQRAKQQLLHKTWHLLDEKDEHDTSTKSEDYQEIFKQFHPCALKSNANNEYITETTMPSVCTSSTTSVSTSTSPSSSSSSPSSSSPSSSSPSSSSSSSSTSLSSGSFLDDALQEPTPELTQRLRTRMHLLSTLEELRSKTIRVPHTPTLRCPSSITVFENFAKDKCLSLEDITLMECETNVKQFPRCELRSLTESTPIDVAWIHTLQNELTRGYFPNTLRLYELIFLTMEILSKESNINTVYSPRNGKVTVVGDIHGQFQDLVSIFNINGYPSSTNIYIFNGDWVDRGNKSCECVVLILAWKLLYPEYVFLNRGNHEFSNINSMYGFEEECNVKYGPLVYEWFSLLFSVVPLACLVLPYDANTKPCLGVFVVHGGISRGDLTLEQIQNINRCVIDAPTDPVFMGLMWSDPIPHPGIHVSGRGAGVLFGPDVTEKFVKLNRLSMIIRSHQHQDKGWDIAHSNRCATVFSASNYTGCMDNPGSLCVLEPSDQGYMRTTFVTYKSEEQNRFVRSSVHMRHLESDVILRLMDRIAIHRIDLITEWTRVAEENKEMTKHGHNILETTAAVPYSQYIISRSQWSNGLKKILQLDIPFLRFQQQLGLPARGVLGDDKGPINFMDFLAAFRPKIFTSTSTTISPSMSPCSSLSPSSSISPTSVSAVHEKTKGFQVEEALDLLSEVIFCHKYQLESVFRYLDLNNDHKVSRNEFLNGILSLLILVKKRIMKGISSIALSTKSLDLLKNTDWSIQHIEILADVIDTNQDGLIQFSEFVERFSYDARIRMADEL